MNTADVPLQGFFGESTFLHTPSWKDKLTEFEKSGLVEILSVESTTVWLKS